MTYLFKKLLISYFATSKNVNKYQEDSSSGIIKDETGRTFGKKEFLETLIVAAITLFLVCIGFSIPSLFPLILLILVVFLIAVLITYRQKRNK
jgi:uncharacterized membrane protein YkvI